MPSQKLGDETHCEMFQFEMHNELMHFLEIGDWKQFELVMGKS